MHEVIHISRHWLEAKATLDDAWNKGWEFVAWFIPVVYGETDGEAIMRKRYAGAEPLEG